jgi:hypothetical protein
LLAALAALLSLTACGAGGTGPGAGTATPDLCAPENAVASASRVNDLMREFDDGADLASHLAADQLVTVIPSLQQIRRRAEDQAAPDCLARLKTLQVTYMNTVIDTLLAFVSGASPDQLAQGIALARRQHEDYNQELAHVLGATYVPPDTLSSAATATASPAAQTPMAASATPAAWVTNSGTGQVNIRARPAADGAVLAVLEAGLSVPAVGKTADGQWIQVTDSQGGTGWIYAAIVTVVGAAALPVVTPAP